MSRKFNAIRHIYSVAETLSESTAYIKSEQVCDGWWLENQLGYLHGFLIQRLQPGKHLLLFGLGNAKLLLCIQWRQVWLFVEQCRHHEGRRLGRATRNPANALEISKFLCVQNVFLNSKTFWLQSWVSLSFKPAYFRKSNVGL